MATEMDPHFGVSSRSAADRVDELVSGRIDPKTRAGYHAKNARIAKAVVETVKNGKRLVVMDKDGVPVSVDYKKLSIKRNAKSVLQCIFNLKTKDDQNLSGSTVSSYRSAIAMLFTDAEKEQPTEWSNTIGAALSGLNKEQAKERLAGTRAKIGKRSFSVDCYKELCEVMMKQMDPRFIFAQAFFKLQFTLIARMSSAGAIFIFRLIV